MKNFAERLKNCRKKASLSQQETAKRLGLGNTTYRRYEYGDRIPNLEDAAEMAKLFHVSLDYLAGLTDEMEMR